MSESDKNEEDKPNLGIFGTTTNTPLSVIRGSFDKSKPEFFKGIGYMFNKGLGPTVGISLFNPSTPANVGRGLFEPKAAYNSDSKKSSESIFNLKGSDIKPPLINKFLDGHESNAAPGGNLFGKKTEANLFNPNIGVGLNPVSGGLFSLTGNPTPQQQFWLTPSNKVAHPLNDKSKYQQSENNKKYAPIPNQKYADASLFKILPELKKTNSGVQLVSTPQNNYKSKPISSLSPGPSVINESKEISKPVGEVSIAKSTNIFMYGGYKVTKPDDLPSWSTSKPQLQGADSKLINETRTNPATVAPYIRLLPPTMTSSTVFTKYPTEPKKKVTPEYNPFLRALPGRSSASDAATVKAEPNKEPSKSKDPPLSFMDTLINNSQQQPQVTQQVPTPKRIQATVLDFSRKYSPNGINKKLYYQKIPATLSVSPNKINMTESAVYEGNDQSMLTPISSYHKPINFEHGSLNKPDSELQDSGHFAITLHPVSDQQPSTIPKPIEPSVGTDSFLTTSFCSRSKPPTPAQSSSLLTKPPTPTQPRTITARIFKYQQRQSYTFKTFLQQCKKPIIESIKMYFTCSIDIQPSVQASENDDPLIKLKYDLTNVAIAYIGLINSSQPVIRAMVEYLINEYQYNQLLFGQPKNLSTEFFVSRRLYWPSFDGTPLLNHHNSQYIIYLLHKLINSFFSSQLYFLKAIYKNIYLIKMPSDLFEYLLRYLLSWEGKCNMKDNDNLAQLVFDLDGKIRYKVCYFLEMVNKKINSNYKMIVNEHIPDLIVEIDNCNSSEIVELALKVLLLSLDFHINKITQDVTKAINWSKSIGMLPFRVILNKFANNSRISLQPAPVDLYRCIKGDYWLNWIEAYLNSIDFYLQDQEAFYLVNALATVSPVQLFGKVMKRKRAIHRFIIALKYENSMYLFYKILASCLSTPYSVRYIYEHFFKQKGFMTYYYQAIIDLITNYPNKYQYLSYGYARFMDAKVYYLLKSIYAFPLKMFYLQDKFFGGSHGTLSDHPQTLTLGNSDFSIYSIQIHRMCHLLLDILNYYSYHPRGSNMFAQMFTTLLAILKYDTLSSILLQCMSINHPSTRFVQNIHIDAILSVKLNYFIYYIFKSIHFYSTFYDGDQLETTLVEVKRNRYNITVYWELLKQRQNIPRLSLYWIYLCLKIVTRQKYNPYILNLITSKLLMLPYKTVKVEINAKDSFKNSFTTNGSINNGLRNTTKPYNFYETRASTLRGNFFWIPQIYENIVHSLNSYQLWYNITKHLSYKVRIRSNRAELVNRLLNYNFDNSTYQTIFHTLRLLRTLLQLNDILLRYSDTYSDHFIIKTLSQLKIIGKLAKSQQFLNNRALNDNSSLILSLLSLVKPNQYLTNCSKEIQWYGVSYYHDKLLVDYLKANETNIDFDSFINPAHFPNNSYTECCENITMVCLEVLSLLFSANPEASIVLALAYSQLDPAANIPNFSTDIKDNFITTLVYYLVKSNYVRLKYNILKFVLNSIGQHIYPLYESVNASFSSVSTTVMLETNYFNRHIALAVMQGYIQSSKFEDINPRVTGKLLKILCRSFKDDLHQHNSFSNTLLKEVFNKFKITAPYLTQIINSEYIIDLGPVILSYQYRSYKTHSFQQLQRLIDYRNLVDVGVGLYCLSDAIKLLSMQIFARKNVSSNILYLNTLLANHNLIMLYSELSVSLRTNNTIPSDNWQLSSPKLFLRDPFEQYLVDMHHNKPEMSGCALYIQLLQKYNILAWLSHVVKSTSHCISAYLGIALSLDRYFYSNNRGQSSIDWNVLKDSQLFVHLQLGKVPYNAVVMFGKSEKEAVQTVQTIAYNIIERMLSMRNDSDHDPHNSQLVWIYQGWQMLGFCLEWLYKHDNPSQTALCSTIRKLNKSDLLIFDKNTLLHSYALLKVLTSVFTLGLHLLSISTCSFLKYCIYSSLFSRNDGHPQSNTLPLFKQYLLRFVMLVPPYRNYTNLFEKIIEMWFIETNDQYFYHEARVVLFLVEKYPDYIIRLRPLTNGHKLSSLSNSGNRYIYQTRSSYNIVWIWTLKIATAFACHQSVYTIEYLNKFINKYQDKLLAVLSESNPKINFAQIYYLYAILELLCALFTNTIWMAVNRKVFYLFTYTLANKTGILFCDYSVGKVECVPCSSNEINLTTITCGKHLYGDSIHSKSYDGRSVFEFYSDLKMIYLAKMYILVLGKAIKESNMVRLYFVSEISPGCRYTNLYWDKSNKLVMDIIKYVDKSVTYWRQVSRVDYILQLINACRNSPYSFIYNGYLSSIIVNPSVSTYLFSDLHLACFMCCELGIIHLLQQKLYMKSYNTLLAINITIYSRKLSEATQRLSSEYVSCYEIPGVYISRTAFKKLAIIAKYLYER